MEIMPFMHTTFNYAEFSGEDKGNFKIIGILMTNARWEMSNGMF